MDLQKIQESTPVNNFPTIYNSNIDELIIEINRLNELLLQKDQEILDIKNSFNSALRAIRSEFTSLINNNQ